MSNRSGAKSSTGMLCGIALAAVMAGGVGAYTLADIARARALADATSSEAVSSLNDMSMRIAEIDDSLTRFARARNSDEEGPALASIVKARAAIVADLRVAQGFRAAHEEWAALQAAWQVYQRLLDSAVDLATKQEYHPRLALALNDVRVHSLALAGLLAQAAEAQRSYAAAATADMAAAFTRMAEAATALLIVTVLLMAMLTAAGLSRRSLASVTTDADDPPAEAQPTAVEEVTQWRRVGAL